MKLTPGEYKMYEGLSKLIPYGLNAVVMEEAVLVDDYFLAVYRYNYANKEKDFNDPMGKFYQ